MQNVIAACSTILLIPIKNSYFNDYQGLSDDSKGNVQVEARHAHLLFFNLIDLSSNISVSNAFWTFDSYFIKIIISFFQDL